MRKPKLKWEKSGRSFVAYAGRLTLEIQRRHRSVYGPGDWFVREVFGNNFPPVSVDFVVFDAAAVAAETYAREALKSAAKALGR